MPRRHVTPDTAAPREGRDKVRPDKERTAMVPLAQFAFVLLVAAGPALLLTAFARRAAPAGRHRGGDPVAFPLRRRPG